MFSGFTLTGTETFTLKYVSKDSPTVAMGTCKAGAFRIHFAESVRKSQTGTPHGECSGFSVTDCQRDEVERAGAHGNSRTVLAYHSNESI